MRTIRPSAGLANVKYEIRGDLARRAHEMERLGYEIVPLNIGNPGVFGFRTPETMRLAMIENLKASEAYSHQKGIFPAREAVVMQQQSRGVRGVSADEVFMGNGVSELIDLVLRALLSTDDEVLVPTPDYPLWTAAVNLNRGRAVHYPCRPENGFEPDPQEIEALITSRTRAIVVINPNNPTGAVYSRATLEAIGFQTRDVLDAMTRDSGVRLEVLKVDGGATVNDLLMQLQADILGVPVVRPVVSETTALGAAYAAGIAVGFWPDLESLRGNWKADRQWEPRWTADQREDAYARWKRAVERSLGWVEPAAG